MHLVNIAVCLPEQQAELPKKTEATGQVTNHTEAGYTHASFHARRTAS